MPMSQPQTLFGCFFIFHLSWTSSGLRQCLRVRFTRLVRRFTLERAAGDLCGQLGIQLLSLRAKGICGSKDLTGRRVGGRLDRFWQDAMIPASLQ